MMMSDVPITDADRQAAHRTANNARLYGCLDHDCSACARIREDIAQAIANARAEGRKSEEAWSEELAELEARANARANRLERELATLRGTWTSTPPTVPGWYWARQKEPATNRNPYPVRVDEDGCVWEDDGWRPRQDFDLWCGPITPPELPR
jgi:hypothetical protein